MIAQPSTIRASNEPTVEDGLHSDESLATGARILAFWHEQREASALRALEAFPSLAKNKTLFLDLVLEEYKLRRQECPAVDMLAFCRQFEPLGSMMERSIIRALEVQEYLDRHPELLKLVTDFDWPAVGDCLQGFQVIEELGRGALARVYLCHEMELGGREVVVKVARGGEYEAALLGRLDHPNIVPVYSVVHDSERHVSYICMPFRGRSTLKDLVDYIGERGLPHRAAAIVDIARSTPQPDEWKRRVHSVGSRSREYRGGFEDGVVRIAAEISGALAHAHSRGIFHGDLKPSNVLLTPDGTPLLIDFNLAKDGRSDAGPRGGTLAYMPPEQLVGIADNLDDSLTSYGARSEIYTLGTLLYQLFTGQVPFVADENASNPIEAARLLLACQRSQQPNVRSRNPRVNVELERLILQCLAIDPVNRPQSMIDVQHRLRAQCRPSARVRRLSRARPVLTACLGIAVLTVFTLGLLFSLLRPPYAERQFVRGMALQQEGHYQDALACFERVLADEPTHRDARYEQARTYLSVNDPSAAASDFSQLSTDFGDPRSAAYAGYCFNLRKEPAAAIEWYEKALKGGFETVGLHNNLGVSYAISRSQLGNLDRFAKAEYHLKEALKLDASEPIVRGNLVTLALTRSKQDSDYQPEFAVEHLEFLLGAFPDDSKVLTDAVHLYGRLSLSDRKYVDSCISAIEATCRAGIGPTAQELSSRPTLEAVRRDPRFMKLYSSATELTPPPAKGTVAQFMDPVDSRGPSSEPR